MNNGLGVVIAVLAGAAVLTVVFGLLDQAFDRAVRRWRARR